MNHILDFIDDLPVSRTRKRTFLEIMKVSNRETIMANLLAFYFQPSEEHGLGDLFIKALLNTPCYELNTHSKSDLPMEISRLKSEKILWAKAQTEDATDDNKRIDIVIETDRAIIAIEFKINHTLNNPLDTYVQHIEGQYSKEKPKYFIVLTPTWKQPEQDCGINEKFRQVLLSHFIEKVEILRQKNTSSTDRDNNQTIYYLNDLISTIKNRKITFDMIKAYQEKAKENEHFITKVEQVFDDLQKINLELEATMATVRKELKNFSFIASSKNKLGCVIENKTGDIVIKLRLNLKGWSIEQWRNNKKIKGETQILDYSTPTEEIIKHVKIWKARYQKHL